jgi:hypothetical protein
MQFTGNVTEADLTDVRKLVRSRMYWPKQFLANWYGIGLLIAIAWATIAGFLGQTKPNWTAVAVIWAVVISIVWWAIYSTKRTRARELTQLNATLPDSITLANDGVKWEGPNGSTGFHPWRTFKGWRERRRVILIDKCDGNNFVILPVSQLSETERIPVRQLLQSHIPPISATFR